MLFSFQETMTAFVISVSNSVTAPAPADLDSPEMKANSVTLACHARVARSRRSNAHRRFCGVLRHRILPPSPISPSLSRMSSPAFAAFSPLFSTKRATPTFRYGLERITFFSAGLEDNAWTSP
jgi:hypothetical protein